MVLKYRVFLKEIEEEKSRLDSYLTSSEEEKTCNYCIFAYRYDRDGNFTVYYNQKKK